MNNTPDPMYSQTEMDNTPCLLPVQVNLVTMTAGGDSPNNINNTEENMIFFSDAEDEDEWEVDSGVKFPISHHPPICFCT